MSAKAAAGNGNGDGDNGFPKGQRLDGMDFLRVMAKGEKRSHPACHAYFMAAEEFKLGLSVSKKLGGAVVRNRIKRVLFEAVRLSRKVLSRPCHMVLVARQGAESLSLNQAKSLLTDLYLQSRTAMIAGTNND